MLSLKTEIKAEIRAAEICGARAGRLIQSIPFRECNSILKQFIQMLGTQLSQVAISIKDTSGAIQSIGPQAMAFKANATNETNYGIVIGTGEVNPVAMDDYKLETQITADIAHNAVQFSIENPDASTWQVTVTRGFTNNTGGTVDVKEVGLYVLLAAGVVRYCIDRTLYDVSFGDGKTLTLTYRITISL
jgi:hypothetical protein